MHFMVVRSDLAVFQHLHPSFDPRTGEFSLAELSFPVAGEYRIIADFAPPANPAEPGGGSGGVTAYADVRVGDPAAFHPIPLSQGSRSTTVDGYDVRLVADSEPITARSMQTLTFEIRRDGGLLADLDSYLGALGHVVMLRERDLLYIHTHPAPEQTMAPQTGRLPFHVSFPAPGRYKAFFQFQHAGTVRTAAFVFDVAPGIGNGSGSGPHSHAM
jgi:hypothetical protein